MKNTRKGLMILAASAALAGSVFAGIGKDLEPRDFTIEVRATEQPVAMGELSYPLRAAERGREGSCDLTLFVSETGQVLEAEQVTCSSGSFKRAATSFQKSLEFAPTAEPTVRTVTIDWTTD